MKSDSPHASPVVRPAMIALGLLLGLLLLARLAQQQGSLFLNRGAVALNHGLARDDPATAVAHLSSARSSFEQAVTWPATQAAAWRAIGFVAYAMDNRETALSAWQQAHDMPAELLAWGHLAHTRGDDETALEWYGLALQLDAEYADAAYYAGLTHLLAGDADAAGALFEEGTRRTRYDSIAAGDMLFRLGQSYALSSDANLEQAVTAFDAALQNGQFAVPDTAVRALFARADALRQLGRTAEASEAFRAVLQADPTHYWARVRLAMLLWRAGGSTAEAEQLLQEAIALDPSVKWAFRNLGTIYEATGRLDEAAGMYRQTLQVDPDDAFAAEHLIIVIDGRGNEP